MTREKIEKIVDILGGYTDLDIPYKREIAKDIIKALEQEPCEDCISRQAVVEWLERATDDSIEHAIGSNLEFIPSVTPTKCIATIQFSKEDLKKICEERIEVATKQEQYYKDLAESYEKTINKLTKAISEQNCISRADALSACDEFNGEGYVWSCIRGRISELPSVNPASKTGHWIYHEKSVSTGFKDLRECSCCRCYFRWEMPRNSYCPNCGARMSEKKEDN